MFFTPEKRARDEAEARDIIMTSTEKKLRMDDKENINNNININNNEIQKKHQINRAEEEEEEMLIIMKPTSVNGISPDGEDAIHNSYTRDNDEDNEEYNNNNNNNNEYDEEEDNEEEEPALFLSPQRALGENQSTIITNIYQSPSDKQKQSNSFNNNNNNNNNKRINKISRPARPPQVRGSVTILHSLQQLTQIFGTTPISLNSSNSNSLLLKENNNKENHIQLKAGETVLIVLHNGRPGTNENLTIIPKITEELSKCRIFRLDLAALPPGEYEDYYYYYNNISNNNNNNNNNKETEERLEEEEGEKDIMRLTSLQLPDTSASHINNSNNNYNYNYNNSVHSEASMPPSISSQITHGTEHILQCVSTLLRVDDILNPNMNNNNNNTNDSNNNNNNNNKSPQLTPTTATQTRGKREELTLPAMVMWRAEGGLSDEYINNNNSISNNNNNNNNTSYGRPLVVKQFTTIDQLHSLSLLTPVYTIEHLFRTIALSTGLVPTNNNNNNNNISNNNISGSKTLIYLGASWCPPCMRIVNQLPQMLKEDFPKTINCAVKADMDLAGPIFSLFQVEIIPTFIVLDNEILHKTINNNNNNSNNILLKEIYEAPTSSEIQKQKLSEGLRASELGRIQNSQRLLVRAFIEKYASELKFDEDF